MFRGGLEPWHIIVLVVVLVLLFGAKKLPDAARSLGQSLRIFKAESRAMKEEQRTAAPPAAPVPPAVPAPAPPAQIVSPIQQPAVPVVSERVDVPRPDPR